MKQKTKLQRQRGSAPLCTNRTKSVGSNTPLSRLLSLLLLLVTLIGGTNKVWADNIAITNGDFQDGVTGWTRSEGNKANASNGAIAKGGAFEAWKATNFTISQTITATNKGVYKISAQAVCPNNGSSMGAQIFANDASVDVTTTCSEDFYDDICTTLSGNTSLGLTSVYVYVAEDNANLQFGLKATNGAWVVCDNFTVEYLGTTATTENLNVISTDYRFTPSAGFTNNLIYEGGKLLSVGGSGYNNGLQFKTKRAIAFKVNADAVIKVTARNNGGAARSIQLGTALNAEHYTDIATLSVASGATSTLIHKYTTGGLVYLTSDSELYMAELEIIYSNGYTITYVYNGHGKYAAGEEREKFALPNPLQTPPAADGYTFVGWYNDNGTFTSAPSAGENLSADKDLFAKWMITKGNNVKLDANGITTTVSQLVQPQTGMAIALPSAYETAEDIAIPDITGKWSFAEKCQGTGYYPLGSTTFREAYYHDNGVTSVPAGDVLTQSTSVANGRYEVILDVAASATNIRDFNTQQTALPTGQNLTKAFAGNAEQFIPVIDRTDFDPETDYDRVVLVTDVTTGTLTYGIKNDAPSGNWYVCRVHSIKKIDDSNFTGWYDAKTGGNKVGNAGDDYTPASNNGTLYAHWNKTYTFRPVASNGNLVSVTVNNSPISVSNNETIKVPENATIVMTVTPQSGYKLKNWVANGTTGTENDMVYTISAINANTVLTAKFETLGDATTPNPANGTLNSTTVTINPFPASYAGLTQSIDLGLPTGATFTVTSNNAEVVDGKLSVIAPNAQQSVDVTIQVTAENGTTKNNYTVHVSTVEGASFSYTVNAVDGSTVLKTIASGDYAQGTGNITVYYPQHVFKDGKLYELTRGDNNNGWYRKIFSPDANNYKVDIEKSAVVDNVVYFTEAEDLSGFTPSSLPTRASMGMNARSGGKYTYVCTLKKGTYKISARGDGDGHDRVARFRANNDEVYTFIFSQVNTTGNKTVKITEDNTEIYVSCEGTGGAGLDWFYIQDLGVLPVTEDGQEEYLTQTNCEANSYLTASISDGIWDSKTFENVSGNYMKLSRKGSIALKSNGALAYEVFVNADASKKYIINNTQYTTAIKGIESRMFECSNNADVTITIAAGGNTVYPVKVKFYTLPLIVDAETTILMGKGAQATVLNVVGGTAELVTPLSAQASALVNADFNSATKTLTLTPVKAGVAHLTFNIKDNEDNILNTVDYVVNVVKQQVEMTYLYNSKDAYNASTDGDFHSPIALIKDMDGNDITATVDAQTPILYISDDETLVKFNSGTSTAVLKPNVQGVAKLKAVLYNNPIYENALATYTVSVSSGIDMKLYTPGTDSKGNPTKTGNPEPKINSTLVAKDDHGNTLMTMTYGGYKYQDNLTDKGGYEYSDSKGTHRGMDSWKGDGGKFSAYNGQGTDIYGQAFDNQIDDFGFQVQAQLDSRDEYNRGIQWFKTTDLKTDGVTYYTEYERIKPFSLPCKGAYLKFEAEVNGTLTAYVLQNGNITFSTDEGHRDEPDAADPLGGNPRVYYWFNQDGYRIDPTSFTSKQPLTIGRDWNGELARQIQEWLDRDDLPDLEKYLIDQNAWPVQAEVDANLKKPVPTPQTVVRYQEGYMVAQKAYVKYVVPVVAGDTYYFFSNASKVGAAGFNFLPADGGTVELILPENGGANTMEARTNDGPKNLNCTTDNAATHKPSTTMEMFKTVTLPRRFKANTWSTICLPFHVTETQVEKVFGKGTNLLVFNGISENGVARFQKHVNQDILAGQPYLIYPTGTGIDEASDGYIGGTSSQVDRLTFTNVNFTPNIAVQSYASDNDGAVESDKKKADAGYGSDTPSYIFTGTLAPATVKTNDYFVNNNTGALTRYTGTGTTLNAYYSYLSLNSTNPGAKAISGISFNNFEEENTDDITGIMDVLVEMGVEIRPVEGVFNIAGQKVADSTKNLPAGIYIINGQKVYIK